MIKYIGTGFPPEWLWSKYEKHCIDSIMNQVEIKFPNSKNLVVNLTWFGPQFDNGQWAQYLELQGQQFDNLFLLSTVDPAMINPPQIEQMVQCLGNPQLHKIGNFDTEYHFNFFAPVLKTHFRSYTDQELELVSLEYIFINYNRKPREHRVNFVKQLINKDLKKYGIVTLGKPNVIYDKDPDNDLYFSIGEKIENYAEDNHWFKGTDEFEIPHDVLTLHRMDYWQRHFLYIIGATEFNVWDDIFVSETQFKPILGLRPFLINGNPRTYQWLEDNGFKTFNKYFDWIDFTDPDRVHESLCQAIQYLATLTSNDILEMYNHMLPDLYHNRARFYEYADEQQYKINHIFE
jgi:hypothetical protein